MEKFAKKTSKQQFDQEVARVAQKILKKNQELKSFDAGFASTVSSTGTILKLSTIPQDDSDSGRDGDAVRVNRVSLHGTFTFADTANTGRLIVARWNQDDSSSAPSAVTDVLQTASPYSPYNRDNFRAKKFTVWFDEFVAVGATGPNIEKFKCDRSAMSNISFQATATTGTGHFYAFMISDSSASIHPGFAFIARVWYTDS